MPALSFELVLIAGRAIVLLVSLLILAAAFVHWRRDAARDSLRMFEQLDLIRLELLLLTERMGSQAQVATTAKQHASDSPRISTTSGTSSSRGYELAARLARGGATCEELIRSCGLSRHEAELLLRLHTADTAHIKVDKHPVDNKGDKPPVGEERRAHLSIVG
jgi:hypothetical protein